MKKIKTKKKRSKKVKENFPLNPIYYALIEADKVLKAQNNGCTLVSVSEAIDLLKNKKDTCVLHRKNISILINEANQNKILDFLTDLNKIQDEHF